MADLSLKLERVALTEVSDEEEEEVPLVTGPTMPSVISVKKAAGPAPASSLATPIPTSSTTVPILSTPTYTSTTPAVPAAAADSDSDEELPAMQAKLSLDGGGAGGAGGSSDHLLNDQSEDSTSDPNGVMVLALLDKIIGVVDQIQQTQNGLEARQTGMEKSVSSIHGELTKLAKSHSGTSNTVNKMLDKLRKVNSNVKGVRGELEKQAGQIKKLENNEHELLRRKNFKVMIYQEKGVPEKKPAVKVEAKKQTVPVEGEAAPVAGEGEQQGSDVEVEVEETVEESRAARIKRSGLQRVENIKKAFSKENMEKTKQKTKENLEKTRQRTRENLEKTRQRTRENMDKTRHNLELKMNKLGTERKEKLRVSRDKLKKSLHLEHGASHPRPKTATYRVPPFTFHVKKIREGQMEVERVEVEEEPKFIVKGGLVEVPEEDEEVEVAVEEGVLVSLDSPEMEAVLEAVDSSKLVLVDTDLPGPKKGK